MKEDRFFILAEHWKEILRKYLDSGISFAVYREPGNHRGKIIIQSYQIDPGKKSFSFHSDRGFVFVPFNKSGLNKSIFIRGDVVSYGDDNLPAAIYNPEATNLFNTGTSDLTFTTADEYYRQVQDAVYYIEKTTLSKVVLSRIQKQDKPAGFDIFNFFEKICHHLPDAFCYIFYHASAGLWCGASPELLIKFDGSYLETVALAGTKAAENVCWKEKEIVEQQLVSDYILEKLRVVGIREVNICGPLTAKAGNLFHLKTVFSAPVEKNFPFQQLADILHPTPAVCGLPGDLAMKFIGKTENHNRSYYAGYAGPVNIDIPAFFHVNLRCMQVFDDVLALYVGAGITRDSDPGSEWEETCHKAMTLISLLENK